MPPEARHLIEVGCWQIKSGQPPNWIRAGRVEAWVAAFWNVEWFYPLRWWEKVYLGRRVAIRGNVLLVAKDWAAARDRDFDQLIWLSPPPRAKRLGPLLESIEFAE